MPLPPRGAPARPLHLAIRSMRLLGAILLIFSTCMAFQLVNSGFGGAGGAGGGAGGGGAVRALVGMTFYLVPGAGFLVLASFLARTGLGRSSPRSVSLPCWSSSFSSRLPGWCCF